MFHASTLIIALIFGQVGAGFLHNRHDAHEAVIDLDNDAPVLLNHGEHCKVCAIDWVSQFLAEDLKLVFEQQDYFFCAPVDEPDVQDQVRDLDCSRAPPHIA
jgi:hypothetical protein